MSLGTYWESRANMRLGAVMQSYERETDVLEVVIAPDSFVYTCFVIPEWLITNSRDCRASTVKWFNVAVPIGTAF